jgi:hypothetical protein
MAAVDPVPWVDPEFARLEAELAALGDHLAQAEAELVEARARLEAFTHVRDRLLLPLYAELAEIEAQIAGVGAAGSEPAGDEPAGDEPGTRRAGARAGRSRVSGPSRASGRAPGGRDAGVAGSRSQSRSRSQSQARSKSQSRKRGPGAADPAGRPAVPPTEARRLYRALAKRCHPDLGGSEEDRERRRAFMVRVNNAYANGEADLLAWLAAEWDPAGAAGPAREVRPDRLQRLRAVLETGRRRLAQVRDELATVTGTGLGVLLFDQEDSAMEPAISRLDELAGFLRSRIGERRQVLEDFLQGSA